MNKATQIARYLIKRAAKESEREFLTPLRLQKLLYYVQGWSLALRGNPIFNDPIEAWVHGPVVSSVYDEYKCYEDKPIMPTEVSEPEMLTDDEMAFINSIWEHYKRFSAIELRNMTHEELPWLKAREGYGCEQRSTEEIPQTVIVQFFRDEFRKTEIKGFELEKVIKIAPASKVRHGRPFVEILAQAGLEDAVPSN